MPSPLRAALIAALFLLLAPAAHAGTASVTTTKGKLSEIVKVEYVAAAGERNDVTATIAAGEVSFRDTGVAPKAGSGCIAALDTVRCTVYAGTKLEEAKALNVVVQAGDGDDRVRLPRPGDTGNSFVIVLLGVGGGEGTDDLAIDSPAAPTEFKLPFVIAGLEGGPGDDTLAGGDGDDLLGGGAGRDTLHGGAGADTLSGDLIRFLDVFQSVLTDPQQDLDKLPDPDPEEAADDMLDGGAGNDNADYSGHQTRVVANLADPGPDGAVGESDVYTSIEGVSGGNFGNDLTGDEGANVLSGGKGDDHLVGAGGDDSLYGEVGRNQLDGGAGDDLLDGAVVKTRCGSGTDHVVQETAAPLDGLTLRRDCEFADFGLFESAGALRIKPLRVRGGRLLLPVLAFESIEPADRKISVRLAKPGGAAFAKGTVTLPAGTERGRAVTLRLKLSAKAQAKLRTLKRVRLRLASGNYSTTIDLPVGR